MKKRIVSLILVLTLLISSLSLTACGGKENYISVGQWLTLVNQTFGMESYQSTIPYFKNVSEDNPFFSAVQIAKEWDVIDSDTELDVEKNLTWQEALITLVNVGNFTGSEASDDEKIQYAIENFDDSIREYWLERDVPVDEAMVLLGTAHHKWTNSTYDHVTEEITFKEGIVELNNLNGQLNYRIDGNVVIIPIGENINVKSGDIYVLPANNTYPFVQTFKAESVQSDNEFIYITNSTEDVAIEDIVEELFIQETFEPTMENAVVYDANGNVISVGENISKLGIYNIADGSAMQNVQSNRDYNASQMGATIGKTIKVDDVEISYEIAVDGKLDFKASIKSDNLLDSDDTKLQANGSVKISNLKITNDVDYGIVKGLKHASLKVDYKTTTSAGLSLKNDLVDKIVAPYNNANNKFLTNLKNSSLKDRDAKGAKTIKICSVDVYSVGVARVCLDIGLKISANGSVSVTVTESGSKGLEYKNGNLRVINDCTKDTDVELKGSLELTAGIGPGLYVVGLKKQIIGAQLNVGLGAEASVTAHLADAEMHLLEETSSGGESPEMYEALLVADITADANSIAAIAEDQGKEYKAQGSVKLHCDVCTDIKGYFILRISLTDESLAADLLKGKVKVSWEILGKNNAKLFNVHIDNLDFENASFTLGNKDAICSYKYVPFDEKEEAETEIETQTEVETGETELSQNEVTETTDTETDVEFSGDMITLDAVVFEIKVGENGRIAINGLPKGYTVDDITYKSNDSKVVSVDANGNFKGLQEGTAMITISTKDGKYKQYCAISVWSDEEIEFSPVEL